MTNVIISITIAAYLVMMVLIGVYYSRKNKNTDDFYLGGRKLGPFVTAMSAEASDMSGWLLMGLPGLAFFLGIAEPIWTALGLAVGTYLNWLIVSKRIRRYTQRIDSVTLPEFFSKRYGDKRNIINLIAAIMILIFFVPYTASGFVACGKLFHYFFGADYTWAMIAAAVVIVAYTVLGGFLAASTSDFVQSIVMTVSLVGILIFAVVTVSADGASISEMLANMAEDSNHSIRLSLTETFTINGANEVVPGEYGFLTIVSTLAWGLGYFGMPHILLRFMAIEDEKKLKTSRRVATVWVVISMAVTIMIGVLGALAIWRFGDLNGVNFSNAFISERENIIMIMAKMISENGWIFVIFAGLVLSGILAATMSTADSQLLAASSSASQNIVTEFFGIKLSQKKSMLVARGTVIVIAILGVLLALDPNSSVFDIVSFAWAGFGAAFGPLVLMALFWKNSNQWGALFGMLTGGSMVFIWKFLLAPLGGAWAIYELLPAFLLGLAVNVVVSLATGGQTDRQILKEFDEVAAKQIK